MRWPRRLWYWYFDALLGAWWQVRYRLRPGEPESLQTGERAPVLLIPGVYETYRYLLAVGRRLHEAGHPVHVLHELEHNTVTIADGAAIAQRYLDERDLRGVVIVAHSKGGLIGKHMMAVNDTSHRVGRMVAIASPFGGSVLARFAPVSTLRIFRATDPTLSTLAKNLALNARITSIFPEWDPMIPTRSELQGATNVEIPVIGHFRILVNRAAMGAVLDAVDPV
ncbi:MAG TPA: alpha/beta hydrolase [Rhodoglobus sp.]|nr:alpha/beta hydrolase [Rhodoglobus sp.]